MVGIKVVTKMYDCFTICQQKTEGPKKLEISKTIIFEVRLFWCEIGMLFPP